MTRRIGSPVRIATLAAVCLLPAGVPAGDYFYAGGERRELTRLEGVWAVPDDASPSLRAAGAPAPAPGEERWRRHGVRIVRSQAPPIQGGKRLATGAQSRFANPVFDYGGGRPLVVTDEFIACFPPGTSTTRIAEINRLRGASVVRDLDARGLIFLLRAGGELPGELEALRLAALYVESGDAVWAHPNFIARKEKRFLPNDPWFPRQWHLVNQGQEGATVGEDVDAPAAWDITRGDPDVVIAVIDDGVQLSHEEFGDGKFVPGYDFYDGDDDPGAVADNQDFHGTAVAGVAAAAGDNGIGVSGIAPGCRIMPVRLVAGETSDEQDAAAIRWAADQGASIISNSWGPPDGNPLFGGDEQYYPLPDVVRAAIDHAADEGRGGKGCVILWAAGNGNEPVGLDGYASYGKVLAVGACDDRGLKSYYSDYGPELDLSAPSDGGVTTGIWTTDLMGADGYNTGTSSWGDAAGNYANNFGGTSSATPLTSGIAALLLSREPDLTRTAVMERLEATADRVDIANGRYDLSGNSPFYGFGRVNAFSALTGRTRHPDLGIEVSPRYLRSGEAPSLRFSLRQGRKDGANAGALHLVIITPGGRALFVTPEFGLSPSPVAFIPRLSAADLTGVLGPFVPPPGIPPGRYTIYAGLTAFGGDPLLPSSWLHTPARADVDILP